MNIKYIVGGLIVIAVVGFGAWLTFGKFGTTNPNAPAFGSIGADTQSGAEGTSAPAGPREVPDECGQVSGGACTEYKSSAHHFSLFHSDKQTVQSFDEGGGAQTITFQDVEGSNGFQIYALPFSGTQVTEERFKMDVPSGVRDAVKNAIVGGASGAAFYSKNQMLGETYEVWFIHGGYLYEVTTLKPLESMLNSILSTWRFL